MADKATDLTRGLYRKQYGGFVSGKRICKISLQAEAWFWRINAAADDFGNTYGDINLLRSATVGLRVEVSCRQIKKWVDEMIAVKLIKKYEANGDQYLHIKGFMEMQPAGKNGKRIQRHPRENGEDKGNPSESSATLKNPDVSRASSASEDHTDTHAEDQDQSEQVGFAEFWNSYPSGIRKVDKRKCEKHWRDHRLENLADAVLAALEVFKSSRDWTKDGGQFIPAPLVWLRKGAWLSAVEDLAESAESSEMPDVSPSLSFEELEAIAHGKKS